MHSWRIEDTSRLDVADKPLRNSTSSRMSWMMNTSTHSTITTRTDLIGGESIGPCTNWPLVSTRRLSMKVTIQVLIESPGVLPLNVPIQTVDRPCERVEDVGLRLEEAKAILQGLQEQLIR